MEIYKDVIICLMFTICLKTTQLYKTEWLTTPIVFNDYLTCGCVSDYILFNNQPYEMLDFLEVINKINPSVTSVHSRFISWWWYLFMLKCILIKI